MIKKRENELTDNVFHGDKYDHFQKYDFCNSSNKVLD